MRPSRSEVLELLHKQGVPPQVICHCVRVEEVALEIAERISRNMVKVDLELVSLGALLHDIGRSSSHSLDHGLAGASIIRGEEPWRQLDDDDRESLARICERHIGGGIPASHAVKVGLPDKDFLPETVEEMIVAHADNLVWDGVLTHEESLRAFEGKFGKNSPIVRRVIELSEEVERLAGTGFEEDHDTGEDL